MSHLEEQTPPSIHIHAELLPNIRQLTLHVSLPRCNTLSTESLPSTIALSESRRAITVYSSYRENNEDIELCETLKLPVRVSESSRLGLSFSKHRGDAKDRSETTRAEMRDFSFRLQVDDQGSASMTTNNGLQEDDFIPWTAQDMTSCVSLHCRFCSRAILNGTRREKQGGANDNTPQAAWTWKDMPSGNWAEMMDFWHCHKPDSHQHDQEREQKMTIEDQNSSVKGYGAANQVVATAGTVLIDVASFLVAEKDCQQLTKVRIRICNYLEYILLRLLSSLVSK